MTSTERLLQYSDRYRSPRPSVQNSFEHALELFEVDNDYQTSFDEVPCTLETVEPDVTDRSVSLYEKAREQVRL